MASPRSTSETTIATDIERVFQPSEPSALEKIEKQDVDVVSTFTIAISFIYILAPTAPIISPERS